MIGDPDMTIGSPYGEPDPAERLEELRKIARFAIDSSIDNNTAYARLGACLEEAVDIAEALRRASGIRVARCDFDGETANPECAANARLIAAAPDLLKACEATLAKFTGMVSRLEYGDPVRVIVAREHGALIEQLKAAIAKATSSLTSG